jgi:hypothetical protein
MVRQGTSQSVFSQIRPAGAHGVLDVCRQNAEPVVHVDVCRGLCGLGGTRVSSLAQYAFTAKIGGRRAACGYKIHSYIPGAEGGTAVTGR